MKNKFLIVVLFSFLFAIPQAFAQREVGNGGDFIREGFILEGKQILVRVNESASALAALAGHSVSLSKLDEALSIDVVKVTDDALIDNGGSDVDALFDGTHIWLNRRSWQDIMAQDNDVDLLIFHEMLRYTLFNDDNYLLSSEIFADIPAQAPITSQILAAAITNQEESQEQTPPVPAGSFTYNLANARYQSGLPIENSILSGTWKMIGSTALPHFANRSRTRPDFYDENATDTSHLLTFKPITLFDGTMGQSVQSDEQGPNAVTSTAAGSCFSVWAYNGVDFQPTQSSDTISNNTYYHYACRSVDTTTSANKMICAIRFQVPGGTNILPFFRQFIGRTVYFFLYEKK